MELDGDDELQESERLRPRCGTGHDKGIAASLLSGYPALELKKILACLRP